MRKALVTGATGSLGKAIVEEFRSQNYEVITTSRKIRSDSNAHITCDLTNPSELMNLCEEIKRLSIDIIVNNAGINVIKPFSELSNFELNETLTVNLLAPVYLTQALLPHMISEGWGRVINVGSILGQISRPGRTSYSISKAGLAGFTRAISAEYAQYGITSNCVAPGYLDSELTRKNLKTQEIKDVTSGIPAGRLGTPEEISSLIAFLASENSSFVTGQTITADGGQISV